MLSLLAGFFEAQSIQSQSVFFFDSDAAFNLGYDDVFHSLPLLVFSKKSVEADSSFARRENRSFQLLECVQSRLYDVHRIG